MTAQHHIIKESTESLARLFQEQFRRNGYSRVHIVEQAPKPDAIEGKLPSVSLYLYQISVDPDGFDANVHNELVSKADEQGETKEFSRRRRLWVRLDYLISAWAQTPEDEQLLLGIILRTIIDNPSLRGEDLLGSSFEPGFALNLEISGRLDEGTLSRFWGSLNQPIRPAIQAWSTVPIVPERLEEIRRVRSKEIKFSNLHEPGKKWVGASGKSLAPKKEPK